MAIANDCPFGLGSSVFSGSRSRARRIGAQLEVGGWLVELGSSGVGPGRRGWGGDAGASAALLV